MNLDKLCINCIMSQYAESGKIRLQVIHFALNITRGTKSDLVTSFVALHLAES